MIKIIQRVAIVIVTVGTIWFTYEAIQSIHRNQELFDLVKGK